MRCEFNDGLRVSYSGKLRIHKGDEVSVALDRDEIPLDIQDELLEAALHESCREMRDIAREVTETFGTYVPE